MATASQKQKLANRSDTSGAQPLPDLMLPELPEKIARLDPVGAKQWTTKANVAIKMWLQKVNVVNQNVASKIIT